MLSGPMKSACYYLGHPSGICSLGSSQFLLFKEAGMVARRRETSSTNNLNSSHRTEPVFPDCTAALAVGPAHPAQ